MQYDRQGFAAGPDGTRLFYGVRGPRPAPSDVPASERSMSLASERSVSAARPAFVLTDGVACDGFAWKYLQPYLAEQHRVVHWHYRAHGRSGLPQDPARIDPPAHARDLLAVMDAAEVESAILVGHSMGTQVALEAYRFAPERVRGLVLLCGSYGKITTTFHGSDLLDQVLPTIIDVVEKHQGIARALWGRIPSGLAFRMARMSREVDALSLREEDFRWYVEHVATMEPGIFLAMLRLAGEHTAEDLLEHIQVPTLVIAAERDTFTPYSLAEHMAETIPGADFFLLRGASHSAPVEQPVAIELRLSKWLADNFTTQRAAVPSARKSAG